MSDLLESRSPADPSDVLGRFPVAGADLVDAAVARCRAAFPPWRDLDAQARAAALRRFAAEVDGRREELARLIAREVGKALWEARAEAALVPAKVEVTLGEGLRFSETLEAGSGARSTFHPRGVMAVLGPFNFPAHLPNGHIVPALATGNTVVFKPSEKAPAVGAWLAEAWRAAGLPHGVLEVVHGAADTGCELALHPGVDAVLFTGSYAVGRALAAAALDQPGKLLALEMGGKNAMVVLADADLELAAVEAALSMCASTGQRCTSLSRLFVEETVVDAFQARLVPLLEGLRIGAPLDEETFMGPLVDQDAFTRLARFRCGAPKAAEVVLRRGPGRPPPFVGPGLVRFADARQESPYQREEIFGPEAGLHPVADLDAAIAAVNDSDYGLAASVMTRRRSAYEHCVGRIRTGILNWNRGTIGASGRLPFGGGGRSGNDRPAGVTATLYCTVPQSHLEYAGGFDPGALPPGVPQP
jgi:succinylglutamic semialdehyde dehydrogenase